MPLTFIRARSGFKRLFDQARIGPPAPITGLVCDSIEDWVVQDVEDAFISLGSFANGGWTVGGQQGKRGAL
jgi:hypothetical protein